MTKPVLYAIDLSPPVRAVRATAAAIELELENKPVDLASGEHLQEWYLKLNPQHTVPTLDDNGVVIWDSHAIIPYLVEKYAANDSLYPKDLAQRARVDQRLHFDSGSLFTSLRGAVFPVFRAGATEVAKEKTDAVLAAVDFLEIFLEKDEYLVGNTVTIADICCVATVSTAKSVFGLDVDRFPKTNAWIERLEQLPYINKYNGEINATFREFFNGKLEANKAAAKQ